MVYGQTIPTAFITITSPTSGTVLPASFTVSGNAAGLTQSNLVVQALAGSGAVLAQQPTTLQGPNVGTGGPGTWSVQLTISVPAGTPGTIVAFAPSTSVRASLPVIYGQSTPTAFVTITSPPPGSVLPASFTVSGNGAGLFEGTVVVRALTNSGAILAEQPTMLQGTNVGSGGQGTWSVPLTVTVAAGTPGAIVAFAPGTTIQASVSVVYGSASPPYKVFLPGQCQIQVAPGTPFYLYPTGPQIGQFGAGGSLNAIAGFKVNDQPWYQVNPQAGQNSPPYWVPGASTTTAGPGCAW